MNTTSHPTPDTVTKPTNLEVMKKNLMDTESTAVGAVGAVAIVAAKAVPALFPSLAWVTPLVEELVVALSSLYLVFRARKGH